LRRPTSLKSRKCELLNSEKVPFGTRRKSFYKVRQGTVSLLFMTLLSSLAELCTSYRIQISALMGIAPLNRDIGLFLGKQMIWAVVGISIPYHT